MMHRITTTPNLPEEELNLNIYEEDLNDDSTMDLSAMELEEVPSLGKNLLALYLNNNKLKTLPEDFFTNLPVLMWLDLRDNRLTDIPKSIVNHQVLTHLLLQNNCLTSLPNELGTVSLLKVLQLSGNPLMYPPREVISEGTSKVIEYLNEKYLEEMMNKSQSSISEAGSVKDLNQSQEGVSYNSVLDHSKLNQGLSVKFGKDANDSESGSELYGKIKGKCPKLDKSRYANLPSYYQSAKYLKPQRADQSTMRLKEKLFKDIAAKKRKQLLEKSEKILQTRKTIEQLKNWRKEYRHRQFFTNPDYKIDPSKLPYGTNPEYMTLLTREDIEKDLPDKYRKSITRRSKISVPRKNNNDVHLAIKIKKLFENLEAIDLNRDKMTPRTEQKVLLNEIQKITEIKQKLAELSAANFSSV